MLKYFNNLQNLTTNGNETKSDIFSWDIFKSDIISHLPQTTKMFLYLAVSNHYKSENKQVKRHKITQDMCKSDGIFPHLQRGILFK